MLSVKRLFILSLFCLVSLPLQANELNNYFANLTSFSANFKQKVSGTNNETLKQSEGVLIVKSPDRFYLEYSKPYKQVYVADGQQLWSYDEDLEQVTVQAQANLLMNSPAMLLSQPDKLNKAYHVKRLGYSNSMVWFRLTPKSGNANFETVSLAFKKKKLVAMEMKDSFGQVTYLEFNQQQKNIALGNEQFRFTPPKGVDIIRQ